MRGRLETGFPADAAARQRPHDVVAEKPGDGVGSVARVDVLGHEADERTLEALVQRREHDRKRRLADAGALRERVREGGELFVLDQLADEGVKNGPVQNGQ